MKYRYDFQFSKTGDMIYISHLDLIRLFGRAIRRAGLPIALTQGFNPHPRLKLVRALKLGVESLNEKGQVVFNEKLQAAEVSSRLQKELPEGLNVGKFEFSEI